MAKHIEKLKRVLWLYKVYNHKMKTPSRLKNTLPTKSVPVASIRRIPAKTLKKTTTKTLKKPVTKTLKKTTSMKHKVSQKAPVKTPHYRMLDVFKKEIATGKRKISDRNETAYEPDNDGIFGYLIFTMGYKPVLELFAEYLGRNCLEKDKCGIKGTDFTENDSPVSRHFKPTDGWHGLAFDGAHWKGYDADGKVYNSYNEDVQIPGTNNLCQSFACFLWASKGLKNHKWGYELKRGEYAGNITTMCRVIHDFVSLNRQKLLEHIPSIGAFLEEFDFVYVSPEIDPTEQNLMDILLEILEYIQKNKSVAAEFSQSQE